MNAGKLNKPIIIYKSTSTQNEYGEQVPTWSVHARRWAGVEPLKGREYWMAAQTQSEIETRFTIRYTTGIKEDMKVTYNSLDYNIESVINVNEKDREIQLMCSRKAT